MHLFGFITKKKVRRSRCSVKIQSHFCLTASNNSGLNADNMNGHKRELKNIYINIYIQVVSRLVDITAGGDFLGLCDQKSSYKHVSDFGRLRSYGHFLIPVHSLV